MLLQALYEFAKNTKARHGETLLAAPEFNGRYVSWLIDIQSDGRFLGFIPLMSEEAPGLMFEKLPRTLEPKDTGSIAEFLVEDILTIFGLGEAPDKRMKDKAHEKYVHYWSRIEQAARDLNHQGLWSILIWKKNILQKGIHSNPVYELYQKPGSRSQAKEQWVGVTPTGDKMPLYFQPNASIDATFRVDGEVVVRDEKVLNWWRKWTGQWLSERENACWQAHGHNGVCVLSGDTDARCPIAICLRSKAGYFKVSVQLSQLRSQPPFILIICHSRQNRFRGQRTGPDASYTNVSIEPLLPTATL